ncbi:MAG: Rrf2 family transcriptional regulator [Saprospiraceae bacterium]
MFSKACEHGIRATIHIAVHSMDGRRVSLKEIAREVGSPEAFTAKILQQLVRAGVVHSVKGAGGGFEMDEKQLDDTSLSQIVRAIDGTHLFEACGLGLKACNARQPCPVHHEFKVVRDGLRDMLEKTNIRKLSEEYRDGLTFLKVSN